MGTDEHDWRTKLQRYVEKDTALNNPETYAWSEPSGDDQSIITRGIVRRGTKMNVLSCETEIKIDGNETLSVTIKEPEPTAIFLNESRLAWERRESLLFKEKETIRETGGFSTDTKEFDFLQASQTAVVMAVTGTECYANHKLRQLREMRQSGKKGKKVKGLAAMIDKVLPGMTGRGRPSVNPNMKNFWKDFEEMKNLRDELIHATAGRMERMNVNESERINTWDKTSRIGCPHETVLKLIEYFENDKPAWLERFPRHVESQDENTHSPQ